MKLKVLNLIREILNVLFGDYNGIQVFIAPVTLVYWIDSNSLITSATSLISFRIHYLPLLAFFTILAFVVFMLVKIKLLYPCSGSEFIDLTIQLNVSVMALILIALIIYALSNFLAYFYGIKGTVKSGLYLLFKLYTAILILYHYLINVVLAPFYRRRYSHLHALKNFLVWARHNKFLLFRYVLLIVMVIFFAVRVYQIVLQFLIIPAINSISDFTGFDLKFKLYPFLGVSDIFTNLLAIFGAFTVSNLLFFPIIWVLKYLVDRFLPFSNLIRSNYAQIT